MGELSPWRSVLPPLCAEGEPSAQGEGSGQHMLGRILLTRHPAAGDFFLVVEGGFEDRSGEGGLDVQGAGAGVAEAVLAAGWDEDRLAGGQVGALVLEPEFGLAV